MNKRTGEIEEASSPKPEGTHVGITQKEHEALVKIPFEARLKRLGAMRHVAAMNGVDRITRAGRERSFMEGYDFAMAIHQLPHLKEEDAPPIAPAEAVDNGLAGLKLDGSV